MPQFQVYHQSPHRPDPVVWFTSESYNSALNVYENSTALKEHLRIYRATSYGIRSEGQIIHETRLDKPVPEDQVIPVKTQEELNDEALEALRAKLGGTEIPAPYEPTSEHTKDIQEIAKKLYRAKYKHEWCGEFERTLDEVNENLSVPIKANRRKVWATVEFSGSLQIQLDVEVPETDSEIKTLIETQDAYFINFDDFIDDEIGQAAVTEINNIDVYNITNRWDR